VRISLGQCAPVAGGGLDPTAFLVFPFAVASRTFSARLRANHIPGNPPLPFIASIWRIIFIIFCIGWKCDRLTGYDSPLLRLARGIYFYSGKICQQSERTIFVTPESD
jgi:hypothetical protein